MDDGSKRCNKQKDDRIIDSSSYLICGREEFARRHNDQVDLVRHPLDENIDADASAIEVELVNELACLMSPSKKNVAPPSVDYQTTDPNSMRAYLQPYCKTPYYRVTVDPQDKLKGSTKKLLYLIDTLQSKTYSKGVPPPNINEIEPIPQTAELTCIRTSSCSDGTEQVLKQLEAQTRTLDNIYIQDEDNDCSIFKRLTRKCTCLNRTNYNDLMIHFNEDTKYITTPIGEVIKNIRIVKKFLYMGGTYTKNALLFLNEAFEKSAHAERVEITLGCSHADLCNVFENQTIVTVCISWPRKYTNFADIINQELAASFLHKFAKLEEGRRYLKYTTRIINDIKKVLGKRSSQMDEDVITTLKAALNLLGPPTPQNVSVVYYSWRNDEGKVRESINGLHQFRQYMTLKEVTIYLDLLAHFSHGSTKTDLSKYLPDLLHIFKQMLREYDNSEINIIITKILNNILSNSINNVFDKENEPDEVLPMIVADTGTEPIETMDQRIQVPQISFIEKKPFNKFRQFSKRKEFSEPAFINRTRKLGKERVQEFSEPAFLNRTRKFVKERAGASMIVVPVKKRHN